MNEKIDFESFSKFFLGKKIAWIVLKFMIYSRSGHEITDNLRKISWLNFWKILKSREFSLIDF